MAPGQSIRKRLMDWWQEEPWRRGVLRWRAFGMGLYDPELMGRRMDNRELGQFGEFLAAEWLRRKGRKVLYRNYRGQHRGEVDLVCRAGRVLTFVEVKTRSGTVKGRPADAVTTDKQRLIQRGAQDWLRRLGNPPIAIRFDIVEVVLAVGMPPQVNVIEDAFQLSASSMEGRTK